MSELKVLKFDNNPLMDGEILKNAEQQQQMDPYQKMLKLKEYLLIKSTFQPLAFM